MILKSFGCSFIFGTDLADDGRHLPLPTASNHTWPALLARHLNYEYACCARPGSGNLQIAERVLSHLVDDVPDLVVIGWTWIDRFDYTGTVIKNTDKHSQWCNWKTLLPTDDSLLAHHYYKELHSEFKDKFASLINIKLVIDTLQQNKIPFVMTYMDDLLFDQTCNNTPAVILLQDYIKPYMTRFDGLSFLQWSQRNRYEISANLHPLEQAHQGATDYLIKVFDKQKTNALVQQAHV